MRERLRLGMFLVAGAVLAAWSVAAVVELPQFGHALAWYPELINHVARSERSITDAVTAVVFDYRGFDTLYEEFILFAAAMGVLLLLRELRHTEHELSPEEAAEPGGPTTPVSQLTVWFLLPVGLLTGAEIVSHGHLTPGGGFQGGVILATVALLVYVLGRYPALARMFPADGVEVGESIGAGGFAVAGLSALFASAAFMANWPPKGQPGSFVSSGLVFAIDLLVGLAVGAALITVGIAFLDQLLRIREEERE